MHSIYDPARTIAAVATPPGEGGVAVIRISGKEAISIGSRIFSRPINHFKSHTVHFGKILDGEHVVDEVLLLILRAPRSYTGEDTVEIHCHGGSLITKRVLETVLKAGAFAAGPGEFTYQAFMNGKLDLAQAEAVQQLIGAKNSLALDAASQQLAGNLSLQIRSFQQQLLDLAAILEAWVDFPEEGLEFASTEEVIISLETVLEQMQKLERTFDEGQKIHEGLTLCLIGRPNVGKSSLMNALLGKERAIVTPIPGTTRDILEADLQLCGLHFRLQDTAGIRDTEEIVEQEGIRRSKQAIEQADIIFALMDITSPINEEDEELLTCLPPHKTLVIWNKIDLPHTLAKIKDYPHQILLSAKTGQGIDKLKTTLMYMLWKDGPPAKDEVTLTSLRHKQALTEAIHSLTALISGLKKGISPEFVNCDMRATLKSLGAIIGLDITEDILSAIFSKFCVGK